MGIPGTKVRNPHCKKFGGDSVQWGFRLVGIPSSGDSGYIPCEYILEVINVLEHDTKRTILKKFIDSKMYVDIFWFYCSDILAQLSIIKTELYILSI